VDIYTLKFRTPSRRYHFELVNQEDGTVPKITMCHETGELIRELLGEPVESHGHAFTILFDTAIRETGAQTQTWTHIEESHAKA